jgi:hypothetical protein
MTASAVFDLQLTWAITLGEIKAMSCALSPGEPRAVSPVSGPVTFAVATEITVLFCNGLHFSPGVGNVTGLWPMSER